ncbi:hypothetical protein PSA7680_01686 [Pseudoruegeria aquimaris]|uniref:DUF3604 domain-containing protein n=1 Tax=Pseudoruegeria aquimaris TaxID=393663 RepID=A0A1Y5S9R6_9RHOB|nr:hypothetical protein PSA7680_01686 [Pseudoruegeria aquimaris]
MLFGDLHFHTEISFDAGLIGTSLNVHDAFRVARGEKIRSNTGQPVQLIRSLDFLAVTEHAEMIGLATAIRRSDPRLLLDDWGGRIHALFNGSQQDRMAAFGEIIEIGTVQGIDPTAGLGLDGDLWVDLVETIDSDNEPGVFTSLAGFEWTFTPKGDMSNGLMFPETKFDGSPLTAEYAAKRIRWEPIHEMTQIKGDEETHPLLSPDDEFADFERWDVANLSGPAAKTPEMLQYEYARSALKLGLKIGREIGVNPDKFGMYGTTDSHTALPTTREDNCFGKYQHTEPSPDSHGMDVIPAEDPALRIITAQESASGLTAVWARENTRREVFGALTRKEAYATTGSRLRVRVPCAIPTAPTSTGSRS